MKMTLLDMVQNILSAMSSDEVNSHTDNAESRQVAEIIRTSYFNIISRAQLPENKQLFSLDASGDPDAPILMYRPDNISKIEWIKYDTNDDLIPVGPIYEYVTILPLQQFLDMVHQLDPEESYVDSLTLDEFTFYYRNDIRPTYCTIFKDYIVIFDSYNSAVDATLQESKSMCYGFTVPVFTMEDDFIPDLDDRQFPLLLNEAKSLAFFELKQMAHEKAEQEIRRQWRSMQHNKNTVDKPTNFEQLPDFGRRRP